MCIQRYSCASSISTTVNGKRLSAGSKDTQRQLGYSVLTFTFMPVFRACSPWQSSTVDWFLSASTTTQYTEWSFRNAGYGGSVRYFFCHPTRNQYTEKKRFWCLQCDDFWNRIDLKRSCVIFELNPCTEWPEWLIGCRLAISGRQYSDHPSI